MTQDYDTKRMILLHDFRVIRLIFGDPDKRTILKRIAKTSTRHVIPEGWKWK